MQPIDISVAVWVGFLALFGIATDNGVLVWTYLENLFRERRLTTVQMVRAAVVEAGVRRVRPAMMTTGLFLNRTSFALTKIRSSSLCSSFC